MKRKSSGGSASLRGSKAAKRHRGSDAGAAATSEKLYTQQDAILVLGDGDFTFSRGLVAHRSGGRNLVATSFDSEQKVKAKYSNAAESIAAVKAAGAIVLHGVDATKLQALARQASKQGSAKLASFFKYIIFNFPHTGQQRVHINRALLLDFFESSRPKLEKAGEVHITLKNRPPYSNWQVEDQAKAAGFVLKERRKFNSRLFPGYNHRTTDPQAKTFEAELCTTYVFVVNRSKFPFDAVVQEAESDEDDLGDDTEQDIPGQEEEEIEDSELTSPVSEAPKKSKNAKRKRSKPASKRSVEAAVPAPVVEEPKRVEVVVKRAKLWRPLHRTRGI